MEPTLCRHSSTGNDSTMRTMDRTRKPTPGPHHHRFANQCQASGGGIDASNSTINDQRQPLSNNANIDDDQASKMHPPGARQQHQQQQQTDGSPHLPDEASQILVQPGKRAVHSSSGPPPKKRSTQHEVGGGHSVKRVGTDTLSPPHKRRSTGQGPQSS